MLLKKTGSNQKAAKYCTLYKLVYHKLIPLLLGGPLIVHLYAGYQGKYAGNALFILREWGSQSGKSAKTGRC